MPVLDHVYGATIWNITKIKTLSHRAFCLPHFSNQVIKSPLNNISWRNIITSNGNNASLSNIQSGRLINLLDIVIWTKVKMTELNTSTCHQPPSSDLGTKPNFSQFIFLTDIAKIISTILVANINIFSAKVIKWFYHFMSIFSSCPPRQNPAKKSESTRSEFCEILSPTPPAFRKISLAFRICISAHHSFWKHCVVCRAFLRTSASAEAPRFAWWRFNARGNASDYRFWK
mgnify:CR=1 FL=1